MYQWRTLFLPVLTLFAVAGIHAQEKPAVFLDQNNLRHKAANARTPKRSITLARSSRDLHATKSSVSGGSLRYRNGGRRETDSATASESAITVGLSDLPVNLSGPFIKEQTYDYGISRTFELGGKRSKRIETADANSDLARGQFQMAVWQLTNDLKRKFYTVVLNQSLLNLARENETTFAEIVKHTAELVNAGEISGLDLERVEVEKLKFDTDLANAERDYEVALRDLRFALGGDYRAMDIEITGSIDYEPHQFSHDELLDLALAARPDLKAAKLSEHAADANIRLQDAQRIPDLSLGGGVEQVPSGTSSYTFGVGIEIPVSNRNQGERAKALIDKKKAQTQEQFLTNQVMSDVDKALVAFQKQEHRVDLYRTGVISKVNDIQDKTQIALQAGESSTLELLDAIRTRRDTLAGFYQTLFDYQMSLLDLELATATPLHK